MAEKFARPLEFSQDFFTHDLRSLSDSDKDILTAFLERLSADPYWAALKPESQKFGKYFASPVPASGNDMVVYWTIAKPSSQSPDSETISILKLARVNELQAVVS